MRLLLSVTLSLWATLAHAEILPPLQTLQRLHDAESFRQSKLAPTEVRQILQQIKATAFDTAKSWQKELRVRRISLQSVDGLIVQGSDLLCGATGNCQTWVFRKDRRRWISLFPNQAPVAAGFGFAMVATHRIPDFLVAAHVSADEVDYASYSYDGQNYSVARCYRAKPDGQQAEEKPCKQLRPMGGE
jgi:hypothetical protein